MNPPKPRYRSMIEQVATYRLMVKEALGRHLLPLDPSLSRDELLRQRKQLAGTALARLANQGWLHHHHSKSDEHPPLPGGLPYFTLSETGAKLTGYPEERSELAGKRSFDIAALTPHLAALWFCLMNRQPCHRLEPAELATLFGESKEFATVPHVMLEHSPGDLCVYRCYVPSTTTNKVVEHVDKLVRKAKRRARFARRLASGQYGIAVLLPEVGSCRDAARNLERAGLLDQRTVIVRLGPTPATLKAAIRVYQKDPTL